MNDLDARHFLQFNCHLVLMVLTSPWDNKPS